MNRLNLSWTGQPGWETGKGHLLLLPALGFLAFQHLLFGPPSSPDKGNGLGSSAKNHCPKRVATLKKIPVITWLAGVF